eukprot:g8363.t1
MVPARRGVRAALRAQLLFFISLLVANICGINFFPVSSAFSSSGGGGGKVDDGGKDQAGATYVSFVSIPISSHFEPLAAMAEELYSRGFRVSIALPEGYGEWVNKYAPNAQYLPCGKEPPSEELERFATSALLAPNSSPFSADEKNSTGRTSGINGTFFSWLWGDFVVPGKKLYDSVSYRLRYFAAFQKPMLPALTRAHGVDSPDLIVVDRFAFAGIASAHYHHIDYAINAASLLLDIDNPPLYVSAPYSGIFGKVLESIPSRCLNLLHRMQFRLAVGQAIEDVNLGRMGFDDIDVGPIINRDQIFGNRVVLVNTVFGIEDPRPVPPLVNMVGTVGISRSRSEEFLSEEARAWLSISEDSMGDTPIVVAHLIDGTGLVEEEHFKSLFKFFTRPKNQRGYRPFWLLQGPQEKYFEEEIGALGDSGFDPYEHFFAAPSHSIPDFATTSKYYGKRPAPVLLQGVVQHPAVELLISSGDISDVQKALLECIPVIIVPFLPEHVDLGKRIERLEAGILIRPNQGRATTDWLVEQAVEEILTNKRVAYKRAACQAGARIRGGGGIKKSTNILETVSSLGSGAFVQHNVGLPWYAASSIDVYLVYLAVLSGIWMICKTCLGTCTALWSGIVSNQNQNSW